MRKAALGSTAATGAVVGVFVSRLLFESWPALLLGLASPLGVALAALIGGLVFLVVWWQRGEPSLSTFLVRSLLPWWLLVLPLPAKEAHPLLLQLWALCVGLLAWGLSRPLSSFRLRAFYGLGTAAIAFWGYLQTLAPSLLTGDSGEFQVAAATLGITHPTGYPLYLLLGKLATVLPWGDVAYRVNLLSALLGAATLWVLYMALSRLVAYPTPAAVTALLFGFAPLFWRQANVAEVYSLHLLLVALLLWVVLARKGSWGLPAAALVLGLGLAHHRTILLMAPALLLAFLLQSQGRAWLQRRSLLTAPPLLLAPLLLYLYLPWRWQAIEARPMTWEDFQGIALASRYFPFLRWEGWIESERWALLGRIVASNLPAYGGLALAAVGVLWLMRLGWRSFLVLMAILLLYGVFVLLYDVPDAEVFFLPALLVLLLLVSVGGVALGLGIAALLRLPWLGEALDAVLLAALLYQQLAGALPGVDRSTETGPAALAEEFPMAAVPSGALIVADGPRLAPLRYAAYVLHERPDLRIIMPDTEEDARRFLREHLAGGGAAYLARFLPGIAQEYLLQSVGPLAVLSTKVVSSSPLSYRASVPALATFPQGPTLLEANYPARLPQGQGLPVELRWVLREPTAAQLQPQLRLRDQGGTIWWEEEPRDPVGGLAPMPFWPLATPINDAHRLEPGWGLPFGRYSLTLGLTIPGKPTSEAEEVVLGTIEITPSHLVGRPETRRPIVFDGGLVLRGYTLSGMQRARGEPRLILFWEAPTPQDRLQISVTTERGGQSPIVDAATIDHANPGPFVTVHRLPRLGEESTRLLLEVKTQDRGLSGSDGWLSPRFGRIPLVSLQAPPRIALPFLARFEENILLLEAILPETMRAGERLPLLLRWYAQGKVGGSYTVFVHLLDGEGRIWGQVDRPPVQGTHPTDRWRPGETISDRYEIAVDPNTPPGVYRVEVGLYQPATMQRLLVRDTEGDPIADHMMLGSLRVEGPSP